MQERGWCTPSNSTMDYHILRVSGASLVATSVLTIDETGRLTVCGREISLTEAERDALVKAFMPRRDPVEGFVGNPPDNYRFGD